MNKFNLYDLFPNYFVLVQSGGGGGNLANTILEDEVMAEHNEDTSLLSACRNLMTSITKVRIYDVRYFPKDIFLNSNFPREFSLVATSQMCKRQVCLSCSTRPLVCSNRGVRLPSQTQPQGSVYQQILAAALGPHFSLGRLRGPNLTF